MLILLKLALAPVLIFIFFIYINDRNDREPFHFCFLSLFYGGFSTIVIALTAVKIKNSSFFIPIDIFNAFFMSGFLEEFFKFIFLFFISITNKNLNKKFDGIVYGVFVSLGFAALENIFYVYSPELGGVKTAILRGFLSIPAHGLFGINMGYCLSEYIFTKKYRYIFKSIFIPTIIHGLYNYIILKNKIYYFPYIAVYMVFIWSKSVHKVLKFKDV